MSSTIVFALSLVACAPSVAPQAPVARASASRVPPPAEEPRDQMTIDSCEITHDAAACIAGAGATSDARLAHMLLFHGCLLGSRPACRALSSLLVSLGKMPADRANAEADRALVEGCAFGMNDACAAAGSFSSGADETVRRQEAEEAAAHAKEILRQEVTADAERALLVSPPPARTPARPPAKLAARSQAAATHRASPALSSAPPPPIKPERAAAIAQEAERRRQTTSMQDATQKMSACINVCVAEYSQCARSCAPNPSAPMSCVTSCTKSIEPCTRACGETAQSSCTQDFPDMCETFKGITNFYRHYHFSMNGGSP